MGASFADRSLAPTWERLWMESNEAGFSDFLGRIAA